MLGFKMGKEIERIDLFQISFFRSSVAKKTNLKNLICKRSDKE
jgi:hypothetical protein